MWPPAMSFLIEMRTLRFSVTVGDMAIMAPGLLLRIWVSFVFVNDIGVEGEVKVRVEVDVPDLATIGHPIASWIATRCLCPCG
jgi:hypothetical protein